MLNQVISKNFSSDSTFLRVILKAIDSTDIGITLSNPYEEDNPLVYVNKGFTKITGYNEEEVIGRNCRFLQGKNPNSIKENIESRKIIRKAIKDQKKCKVLLKNFKKNGRSFVNEFVIAPIFDDQGKLEYFLGIQKDITKEYDLENEVKKLLKGIKE